MNLVAEVTSWKVAIMEAKKLTVAEFKEFKEFKIATQDFEIGYDIGVEEIFYNIWHKSCNVSFKFIEKAYHQ